MVLLPLLLVSLLSSSGLTLNADERAILYGEKHDGRWQVGAGGLG